MRWRWPYVCRGPQLVLAVTHAEFVGRRQQSEVPISRSGKLLPIEPLDCLGDLTLGETEPRADCPGFDLNNSVPVQGPNPKTQNR